MRASNPTWRTDRSAPILRSNKSKSSIWSTRKTGCGVIEFQLHTLAFIPDFRGDVLSMLENLDFVLNVMKENMVSMGIEAPNFPGDIHTDILHLTEAARMAVERAVLASRACLRDIQAVKDHLAKMMFCEKEADGHADKLKRAFFASVVWSGGLCLGADIHRFGARLLRLSVLFAERLQPDGVVNMGNTAFPSKCSPATSARWMSRPSRPERQALRYFQQAQKRYRRGPTRHRLQDRIEADRQHPGRGLGWILPSSRTWRRCMCSTPSH